MKAVFLVIAYSLALPANLTTAVVKGLAKQKCRHVRISARDKFAEIESVGKAADCAMLADLATLAPSKTTPEAAAQRLATGKNLSGDFYPQLPSEKMHYTHVVEPGKPARAVRITLVHDNGASEAIPPNRLYTVLATALNEDGVESYLAVEEVVGGTYGMCAYVRIEKGRDDWLVIRDRRFLGRCA